MLNTWGGRSLDVKLQASNTEQQDFETPVCTTKLWSQRQTLLHGFHRQEAEAAAKRAVAVIALENFPHFFVEDFGAFLQSKNFHCEVIEEGRAK